jgi:hypothetical protein
MPWRRSTTFIIDGEFHNMRNKLVATAIAVALGTLSLGAQADSLSDIFTQGHVDGELRAYDFNRNYGSAATPDARAFSAALLLNAQTSTFGGGFSLGGSFASANSLGTLSDNVKKVDTTLMGPNHTLNAMTQAYLQYKNDWFLFKGGYQYLDTPWMGKSDSRVIPSSYDALLVGVTPAKGWNIFGIRVFDWKSRTSDGFYSDNLYYPSTYHDDSAFGNNGSLPATAPEANGTWALGTTYANGGLKAQAWYYNFLRFARTGYADGSYTFKTGTGFDPVVGAQYVTQTGGSDNILVDTNTKLFGVAGNNVKSRAWGADLGLVIPNGRFDVYYNKLSQETGAVGGGALISPYSAGYATDPLYTTSMIRGLVETGPGHAWKAKFGYDFFNKKLQLVAAYAKYTTDLRGDSHNAYLDIIYNLDGYMKGLSIRDRWERSSGGAGNLNPGNQSFVYNRLMISYKF